MQSSAAVYRRTVLMTMMMTWMLMMLQVQQTVRRHVLGVQTSSYSDSRPSRPVPRHTAAAADTVWRRKWNLPLTLTMLVLLCDVVGDTLIVVLWFLRLILLNITISSINWLTHTCKSSSVGYVLAYQGIMPLLPFPRYSRIFVVNRYPPCILRPR